MYNFYFYILLLTILSPISLYFFKIILNDLSIVEKISDDKINLDINISESDKFYIEKINIKGNFNTLEEVIRNNLIVDEGDPFNEILFNKSINIFKV